MQFLWMRLVSSNVNVAVSAPKAMSVHRLEIFEKNKTQENKD